MQVFLSNSHTHFVGKVIRFSGIKTNEQVWIN